MSRDDGVLACQQRVDTLVRLLQSSFYRSQHPTITGDAMRSHKAKLYTYLSAVVRPGFQGDNSVM